MHHLLVDRLEPGWEKNFIHASFACRRGKGGYQAISHLGHLARKLSQGGSREVFALQIDIASFFVTIDRPILTELLLKEIPEKETYFRWLVNLCFLHDARQNVWLKTSRALRNQIPPEKSWFNQGTNTGIPIGNLISQFGANVYLNGVDHFILRQLKPGGYLRYMDDLTLLDTDPEKLKSLISPIDSWLKDHRKQSLNPKKTTLKKLSQGISYLGYRLQQDLNEGGQLKLYAPLHKKYEFIQTLRSFETSWSNSFSDTETGDQKFPIHPLELPHPNKTLQNTVSSLNARLGFLKHAQTKSFRKKSLTRMEDHLTHPEALPLGHYDAWSPVRVRRNFNSFKLR